MVSRKLPGRKKNEPPVSSKKLRGRPSLRSKFASQSAKDAASGLSAVDNCKKIFLSSVGRSCGGEVSIIQLEKRLSERDGTVAVSDSGTSEDGAGKEQQDAIHRLRRLGTAVSLEEQKVIFISLGNIVSLRSHKNLIVYNLHVCNNNNG